MTDPLVDGFLDPASAASALGAGSEELLVRLAPPSRAAGAPPYGPPPTGLFTARIRRGSPEVVVDGETRRATSVDIETRKLAWGGWGGAPYEKVAATVWVRFEAGDPLVAAEAIGADEPAAKDAVLAFRQALGAALGQSAAEQAASADAPPLLAADVARRLGLRMEGDYLVLRDHESRGPRAGAAKYRGIAVTAAALAALTWVLFARELRAGGALGSVLGLAAVAAVLSLAAFAMNEVARFANKYVAESAPLAWFSDDRFVVAPWVSRDGAIDQQPEGRLGAAIRVAEVDGVITRDKDGSYAVTLETQHGPIDAFETPHRELACAYQAAIVRALVAVAAPSKKPLPLAAQSTRSSARKNTS
jgi:hypothetical protein